MAFFKHRPISAECDLDGCKAGRLIEAERLLAAQSKTLKDAGEEIVALNAEAKKYLTEISRLRAAFRVNMMRFGGTDAEIDRILITERTV